MGAGGETGRGAGAEAGRGASPAVPAVGGSKDASNGKAKRPRMPEDTKGASPSAGELLVVVHEALSH